MRRSAWAIALVASAAPISAKIREPRYSVDVPSGDLAKALATLSAQTGASIGTDRSMRGIRSGDVRGRRSVAEALAAMLRPTPFAAERLGPSVWRLRPRHAKATSSPSPPLDDIVVTARKVPETLSQVATPIAVYVPADRGGRGQSLGVREVAASIEGMSVTNLGSGRDRPFIRGIADSPFNGFSQATVSINVDDARVTYDAPEPGLRLVDVARVEVLKGPQGPLYGTGALGGVYRIVTNRPVPGAVEAMADVGLSSVGGGGPGGDASAMVNLPVLGERVAVRLVGYAASQAGWVRDAARGRGVNDSNLVGGRAALRVLPAAGWTVDLGTALQGVYLRDSQYVDSEADDLSRSIRLPEPSSSRFSLVNGTAAGPLGTLRLTVAVSQAEQRRAEAYDVTPVTSLPGAGDRRYHDQRHHRVFDQEVRLASAEGGALAWTAGASYLSATTYATGTLTGADGQVLPFNFLLHRAITEAAIFADGSLEILPRLRAGLGARLFRATTEDERSEEAGNAGTARASLGITPSGSLVYALSSERSVYLRFGTAFRPGGLDPSNTATGRYDADEVRSLDVGGRLLLDNGRLSLNGGAFRSNWNYVQSDYLLPDGLVATRNAGDAVIVGAEASLDWHLAGWRLRAGATVQNARLTRGADGAELPSERNLPVVPDAAGRLELVRTFRFGDATADVALHGAYTGRSRLSFDEGLDRSMGGYALLGASSSLRMDDFDVRLEAENMLDTRGDSFAFGNPFRARSERQFTPLRPRTITLSLARSF